MATFSAATRLVALLGRPVAHSLSPAFQNAAFQAADVDGVYLALDCDAGSLPALLTGIARAGGAGNVTVPHKAAAAAAVERATDALRRTGACNTFWLEDGCVHGDNTDVAGARAAVRSLIGPPGGARVLLLGAGGAASAAVAALLDDGVDALTILNRSPARARALCSRYGTEPRLRTAAGADFVDGERFDLVVNATPLGLHADDPPPLHLDRARAVGAVLDLVCVPGETAWVRAARRAGIPAADGREMLLFQGAAAFERWWGRAAPVDVMRRALEQAAARPADVVATGPVD